MNNQRILGCTVKTLLVAGVTLTILLLDLPLFLKSKIPAMIQQETGRKSSITRIQLGLLPLSLSLQGFVINETNGQPFVSAENLYVRLNTWQSLWQQTLVLDKLLLVNPFVHIAKEKNGKFNFDDLIKNKSEQQPSTGIFPIIINTLIISAGKLAWEDSALAKPESASVYPITLRLENFSTTKNENFKLNLFLVLDKGGSLMWNGEAALSSRVSSGHLKINGFNLQDIVQLGIWNTPIALSGMESFETDYKLNYIDNKLIVIANKLEIKLRDFLYADNSQNKIQIKTPKFSYTTDLKLEYGNNNLLLTVNKSSIDAHNFEFTGMMPDKLTIEAGDFSHSVDLSVKNKNKTWKIAINKSSIDIRNFKFNGGSNKPVISIPFFNHTADLNINNDNNLQVSRNNSGIDFSNFQFLGLDNRKSSIDIPYFNHSTYFNSNSDNNNWKIVSNNSGIDIKNLEFITLEFNKSSVNVAHTANINNDGENGNISSNQSKTDIKNPQYTVGNQAVNTQNIYHFADLHINNSGNGWQITSNKSKIDIKNFQLNGSNADEISINIPGLTHLADLKIKIVNNGLQLVSKNSKIDIQNFQFSGLNPEKTSITVPEFSHSADFNIKNLDNSWQIDTSKSRLDIKNAQFSRQDLIVSGINGSHETDYRINLANNNYQLLLNKSKIAIHDTKFKRNKLLIDFPAVEFQTALDSSFIDNILNLVVNQGEFDSHDLQLSEQDDSKPLLKISSIALRKLGFDLINRKLELDSVFVQGGDIRAWLNEDGVINYFKLLPDTKENAQPDNKEQIKETKQAITKLSENIEKAKDTVLTVNNKPENNEQTKHIPLSIKINAITLDKLGLEFEDRSLKTPAIMTLKPVNFKLDNYSNKQGEKFPFKLDGQLNNSGLIKLDGNTVLEPFSAQLNVDVNDIELEKFQSYLDKYVLLDLVDGALNMDGKLAISKQKKGMDLKYNGNTKIANFVTRDQKQHRDLVTWQSLMLKNIACDVLKNRYTADELIIEKPYARITINKNKTVNFSEIVIADNNANPEKNTDIKDKQITAKTSAEDKTNFKLDRIQIVDGSSDFADNSLIMPFSAQIESLDGGASDISSDKNSNIKVSLKGSAYSLAPVDIEGNISPYMGDYDIKINFKAMPMPLMSPYMVQFAGYKVEKGKMTLNLSYKVDNNELTATNNIFIDQFVLGEKVDNPNAVSLPLELAVTLLKDSNGDIRINVPISGSLEDPKFSIGAIVSDALMTAISKVITSPFRAIASLVGSSADLSTIGFEAGSTELGKAQKTKLDELSSALKKRPTLTLEIKGAAYRDLDWPAIRDDALYDRIKKMRADELNAEGKKKILPEYVELSDSDYKRLLAQLFMAKFPTLAKKSFFGTPELIDPKAGDFYVVAKQKLMASMKQEDQRLKTLAANRAQTIARYLVQQAHVDNEQVYILDTVVDPKTDSKDIVCLLSLNMR